MLLREEVEVRRTRETEAPLVGAGAPPRAGRVEIVRPLPAVLDPEHRAQILHSRMQRARPFWTSPLVGVQGIAKVVVVLVRLACELCDVSEIAMHRAEAPRPVWIKVELALASGDKLRDRSSDSARSTEAVQRESRRHVEAMHSGHRTDQRPGVGSHRVGVTDELDDARLVREGEASGSARQQRLEPRLVRRQ